MGKILFILLPRIITTPPAAHNEAAVFAILRAALMLSSPPPDLTEAAENFEPPRIIIAFPGTTDSEPLFMPNFGLLSPFVAESVLNGLVVVGLKGRRENPRAN